MGHVTRDTWHMTWDIFGGVNILSKFQLPSSYCLWFMILWRSGGKGWLNESMNYEAVYRTAPATPGLLKSPATTTSSSTNLQEKIHVTLDGWHATGDWWHVTHDMWLVTRDTWCGVNNLSKCQLSSFSVWDLWCSEDLEETDDQLN